MNENSFALFQQANSMYQNGNYQACLALLNDCLLLSPYCSQLLNNRGVTQAHLHHLHQAIQDLNRAIQINHLNYMAYFNLFSLHSLGNNREIAFENLCFAISTLHVVHCKESREMWNVQRSLQFSYNNKEALTLKGLLHLEKKQYEESGQFIQQALEYEEGEQTIEQLRNILKTVKKIGNLNITQTHSKLIGGNQYRLRTLLNLPQPSQYTLTIQLMLLQFNKMYKRLQEISNQSKQTLNSSHSLSRTLSQQTGLSYLKDQRLSNCITAPTSLVLNQSDFYPEGQKSSCKTNKESNNILDKSSWNSVIPQESSSVSDQFTSNMSTPPKSKAKTQIHFTIHYAQFDRAPTQQLYTIIQYNSKEQQLYRSPLSKLQNSAYQWNDISQPFELSSSPAPLTIKIYHKEYTCFEDQLIGIGEIRIDRLGLVNIPLHLGNLHRGNILVGVSLNE